MQATTARLVECTVSPSLVWQPKKPLPIHTKVQNFTFSLPFLYQFTGTEVKRVIGQSTRSSPRPLGLEKEVRGIEITFCRTGGRHSHSETLPFLYLFFTNFSSSGMVKATKSYQKPPPFIFSGWRSVPSKAPRPKSDGCPGDFRTRARRHDGALPANPARFQRTRLGVVPPPARLKQLMAISRPTFGKIIRGRRTLTGE